MSLGSYVKGDEMGGVCRAHWRHENCIQSFSWKTLREESTWKSKRRREDNFITDIREMGCGLYFSGSG
jgi:hypothetical protein